MPQVVHSTHRAQLGEPFGLLPEGIGLVPGCLEVDVCPGTVGVAGCSVVVASVAVAMGGGVLTTGTGTCWTASGPAHGG